VNISPRAPKTWLITGVAGFIGSHLLEYLLSQNQRVIGIDNFLTGYRSNLEEIKSKSSNWNQFQFVQSDICEPGLFDSLLDGVDVVLHQAALGSVPRSIADPASTHRNNVEGFFNLLCSLKDHKSIRLVFASSSSVYGDFTGAVKVESQLGTLQSPYAASKRSNEIEAQAFSVAYGLQTVGLRYFNVFGPRQDPNGAYAAVIPKWTTDFLKNENILVHGDGETTRDFCYVKNVVQANILAALTENPLALNQIYNVACGQKTSLNELAKMLRSEIIQVLHSQSTSEISYGPFRNGDIRNSLADISLARKGLGYEPTHSLAQGLAESLPWYQKNILK
jgi:UDP-N-acetylglucosamine 4-epimerase